MKKTLLWTLALVMIALLLPLSALGEGVVNVYNWEDYISQEALDLFTQETGITVNMMNFTTNEDMMVQLRNSPASFDVVFPSDYCIERLIAEDLLEQIVGNIYDEFDPEEPEEIQQISENLWRVSGSTRVEDLAEALDMDIPEDEDYDTVGGMVFSCLHTIPQDGDTLEVEVKGLRIHVKRIEDRRVEEALVEKLPPDERETSEEED